MRLSDPFNDGLLGENVQERLIEGLEAPFLESKAPVTGVDKGQYRKENKQK